MVREHVLQTLGARGVAVVTQFDCFFDYFIDCIPCVKLNELLASTRTTASYSMTSLRREHMTCSEEMLDRSSTASRHVCGVREIVASSPRLE